MWRLHHAAQRGSSTRRALAATPATPMSQPGIRLPERTGARGHRKSVAARTFDVEGVVDSSARDVSGSHCGARKLLVRLVDVVDHEVERGLPARLDRPLGAAQHQMGATAQLSLDMRQVRRRGRSEQQFHGAGFQHQHPDAGFGAQPVCQHTARRPGAANHIVVRFSSHRLALCPRFQISTSKP